MKTDRRTRKHRIVELFDSKTTNATDEMLRLLSTKPAQDILPVDFFDFKTYMKNKKSPHKQPKLTAYQKFIKKIFTDKSVYANAPDTLETARRRKVVVYILKTYFDSSVYVPMFPQKHHPLMTSKRPEMHETIVKAITEFSPMLLFQKYETNVPTYPPSKFYPREYTRGMSTLASVDPLYRSFKMGYTAEARKFMNYLSIHYEVSFEIPEIHNNFHLYLRQSMAKGDRATAKTYLDMLRSAVLNPKRAIYSQGPWLLSGATLLHVAILYGHIDLALEILEMGEEPNVPFVYAKPGRKKIKERRIAIPTIDLVRELNDAVPGKRQLITKIAARLKDTRRKRSRVSHANRVTEWSSETYRQIQNARRGPLPKPLLKKISNLKDMLLRKGEYDITFLVNYSVLNDRLKPPSAKTVNQALAKQFKDHALRAPKLPRMYGWKHVSPPKYLFRGMHPPLSTILYKKGVLKDNGYIATSTDEETARRFAFGLDGKVKDPIFIFFPIESIPPGTPWIWFDHDSEPQSNTSMSLAAEAEVLLPPGTIRLIAKAAGMKATYLASYEPNKNATSLSGRRIMPKR